ncbi:MAG: LPS export ABC transporter permease LptF [Burkholderiales bacterium]|nr:LPS export ABC transporter permease LptF [Burkholderiales bacterium]
MLFDTTVRRELARSFGATLVVILTIVLTMMLIRTVGQAASGAIAPQDVVLLLGYVALGRLPIMLALSLFIAIIVTLGRMYRDSEMAVWFASGLGIARFVRPVLRTSWPVLLVIGLLLVFVWPWGNANSLDLRDRYAQRSDLARVAPGVFQVSSDGSRVFYVQRESADRVDARNVFILSRREHDESVTTALRGHLERRGKDRFLVLEQGQRNDLDTVSGKKTLSSFETYRVLADEFQAREVEAKPPNATPTIDLIRHPDLPNQGELVWRLGLVFGAANLLLLGIGLAATHPRRASNWNLLFALLGFVVYYNLINLSQAWVGGGRAGLGSALVVLHGGTFLFALALLWWRDHAAVVSWRPQRRAAA